MKTISRLSLIGAGCLAAMQIAHAAPLYDQSNSFYIPVSIGDYMPATSRNENSSVAGSFGVGYNLTNYFALQANFNFFEPNYKPTNVNQSGYYLDLEGRLNAANSSHFLPYLVVGAGALKNTNTQFAMDYGVGVDYLFSRQLSAGVSFRQIYQFLGSKADDLASFGVTWTFANPAPVVAAPAPAPAPVVMVPAPVQTVQQAELQKAQTTLSSILPAGVVKCVGNHVGNQPGCVTFEGNQMIMHLNVRFAQNKAAIQSQYSTPIASVGSFMNAYPVTTTILYGYASSEGPLSFNQKLSAQRAQAVKNYLVNVSHISSKRICARGMGIQDPIASNKTLAGRQMNRRVEATIPVPMQLVQ